MGETREKDLKQETKDTVNKVTENIKNINLKEEAIIGRGYLKELVESPVSKIKQIANDRENKHLKTAILAIALWVIVALVQYLVYNMDYMKYLKFTSIVKNMLITICSPVLSIIVMSVIIQFMNNKAKKPLTTVITTVITINIPIILSRVINLINLFSYSVSKITNPIGNFLTLISTVLMFFGVKYLFDEEDNNAVKKFTIVEGIFYIATFIISYLGISI